MLICNFAKGLVVPTPMFPAVLAIRASVVPTRTRKGSTVDEAPVWILTSEPVPFDDASVVKLNRSFAPVPVSQLNVVVRVVILSAKFPSGSVSAFHLIALAVIELVQAVPVPVELKKYPADPAALVESYKAPVMRALP